MASFRNAAANSLESRRSPEARFLRMAEINQVGNPVKRAGLVAVHGAAIVAPSVTAPLAGLRLRRDMQYLAQGYHLKTYRTNDGDVLKVDKVSMGLSPKQRTEKLARLKYEHQALRSYVGSVIVPQEITIEEHPHIKGKKAIVYRQEYRGLSYLALAVQPTAVDSLAAKLRGHVMRRPEQIEVLDDFVNNNRSMFAETGLCTDIVGENVGIDRASHDLAVVDGQPISLADFANPDFDLTPATLDNYFATLGQAVERLKTT